MDKTKGEGGGQGGGGFVWGGVKGWGENADNCNWTTILKKKERKGHGENKILDILSTGVTSCTIFGKWKWS